MTRRAPARVASGDLGRAGRGRDALFGWAACVPLVALAALAWRVPGELALVRRLALAWTACLVSFLGGVRRGLTFSEARGGRLAEIASMFLLFALALAALLSGSLAVGAAGLACAGALDAAAGRRGEAPGYFSVFRPVQMGLCAAAALAVALA
jgi:hypothetical protein